jgi:transposase
MAKTLGKETVAAIEQAILTAQKAGRYADLPAIAAIFNCTYQSVCYIRRRVEKHQRTGIDERKKAGRKPFPEKNQMALSIREHLQRRPYLDQGALSNYLFEEFGRRVSQATISRLLKKDGIPHKISNKIYKKSKLFNTQSEDQAKDVDNSMKVAASALSELPVNSYPNYKGFYALPRRHSGDTALHEPSAAAQLGMELDESLLAVTNGVLHNGPSVIAEKITDYSGPFV